MKPVWILLLLLLTLTAPCIGMPEAEAVTIVVNDLRMDLQASPAWHDWALEWAEWWTVRDLRPYSGFW